MASSVLVEILGGPNYRGDEDGQTLDTEVKDNALHECEKLSQLLDDVHVDVVADSLQAADGLLERLGKLAESVEGDLESLKTKQSMVLGCRDGPAAEQAQQLALDLADMEACLTSLLSARELADTSDELMILSADAQPLEMARLVLKMETLLDRLDQQTKEVLESNSTSGVPVESSSEHAINVTFAQVFSRMRSALLTNLESNQSRLLYTLNEWWLEVFEWQQPDSARTQTILRSTTTQHKLNMSFAHLNNKLASQFMSALHAVDELDVRVAKFSDQLMRLFCVPIVKKTLHPSDQTAHVIIELENRNSTLNERQSLCLSFYESPEQHSDANSPLVNADQVLVFDALQQLFTLLNNAVGSQLREFVLSDGVTMESFMRLLGEHIGEKLIRLIVDECLKPCVPSSSDPQLMKHFDVVMQRAHQFEINMKELDLFPSDASSFAEITENLDRFLIDRRCQAVLEQARDLIRQPLHRTQLVGSGEGDSIDRCPLQQRIAGTTLNDATFGARSFLVHYFKFQMAQADEDIEASLPPLFKFAKCKVSESTLELVELLKATVCSVCADSTSTLAARRLYETSRLIVASFIDLTPLVHRHAIDQVPLNAAIYYNSAYYLAHQCMLLGARIQDKLHAKLDIDEQVRKLVTIGYIDFVPRLRSLANDAIQSHLKHRVQECDLRVANGQLFTGLDNVDQLTNCDKAVAGCVIMLQQLNHVWEGVLTSPVRLSAMATVSSHLLNRCFNCVCQLEDIAVQDAKFTADILRRTIKAVEKLFVVNDTPYHIRFLDRSHARCTELVHVLEGSLQDISDRWCDGAGPAADCLSADVVERLIRALFQNTERRAALINRIRK